MEMIMETDFFEAVRLPSPHAYMDDEQPFSPYPSWPHSQAMAPYCTPGSWMLSPVPSFGTSSFASSPLQWSSGQTPKVLVDNAAVDRFSNNMALERLLPPPVDSGIQQATEIPELASSASSVEGKEPMHVYNSRSKKQQREPASEPKPIGLKPPKGKKRGRKSDATPSKGSKGASKGSRRGSKASEDESHQRLIERNRLAAERCRHRKRNEAQALVAKKEALESQNRCLSSCYHALKEEVLRVRIELLRHTDCDCVLIREYIAREARKTVDSLIPRIPTSASQHGKTRVTTSHGDNRGEYSTGQVDISGSIRDASPEELLAEEYLEHDTARCRISPTGSSDWAWIVSPASHPAGAIADPCEPIHALL